MSIPSLAIVIMADPRRRARAELLAEYVQADVIVWDLHHDGEWSNGAHAWRAGLSIDASHVLVLQDDAEPIEDLRSNVIMAIHHLAENGHPNEAISLYLGKLKPSRWVRNVKQAIARATRDDAAWLQGTHLLHGVAIVLPQHWIRPMLQWCEMTLRGVPRSQPYDQRIGAYLRRERNASTWYTWPSMVDHADTPTLVTHADDARLGTDGRVAYEVGPWRATTVATMIITPDGAEL